MYKKDVVDDESGPAHGWEWHQSMGFLPQH